MHRSGRSALASTIRVIALAIVALLVATACASIPVGGPLVVIEQRGGLCFEGPCESRRAIERDGRVHQLGPQVAELGTVPAEQLQRLRSAIDSTDFHAILGRPFTGMCPTAVDGQELIYEFGVIGGPMRISTCEVEVDLTLPVFAAIDAALGAAR